MKRLANEAAIRSYRGCLRFLLLGQQRHRVVRRDPCRQLPDDLREQAEADVKRLCKESRPKIGPRATQETPSETACIANIAGANRGNPAYRGVLCLACHSAATEG